MTTAASRRRRARRPGVRQREQRHDDVARPRVQDVLQPLDDRHRLAGEGHRGASGLDRRDVGELPASSSASMSSRLTDRGCRCHRPSTTPVSVAWTPDSWRASQSRRRAGRRRRGRCTPSPARTADREHEHGGDGERRGVDVVGVEDGDDQDGADVVDDRQGQQVERRDGTIRAPSRLSTPTAKAMSVAIGMPQPAAPSPPALIEA